MLNSSVIRRRFCWRWTWVMKSNWVDMIRNRLLNFLDVLSVSLWGSFGWSLTDRKDYQMLLRTALQKTFFVKSANEKTFLIDLIPWVDFDWEKLCESASFWRAFDLSFSLKALWSKWNGKLEGILEIQASHRARGLHRFSSSRFLPSMFLPTFSFLMYLTSRNFFIGFPTTCRWPNPNSIQ